MREVAMRRIGYVAPFALLAMASLPLAAQDAPVPPGIDEALLGLETDGIAGMVVFDADGNTVVGDAVGVVSRDGRYYLAMVPDPKHYGPREVAVPLEELRFTPDAGLTLAEPAQSRIEAMPVHRQADYEPLPGGHTLAEVIILPDVTRQSR